jgi:N utilization substance protein B
MGRRRQARICALQILYQLEITGRSMDEVMQGFWIDTHAKPRVRDYAERLVRSAMGRLTEWDAAIKGALLNWRLERLAAMDRNLMRLAAAEYETTDTPRKVVLNEAIEMAKEFGTERSPEFINGVLDRVLKPERGKDEPPATPAHDAHEEKR